jgi:hypothetical protein
MSRFHLQLWDQDDFHTLALLPRIRVSTGRNVGIGLGWLTIWFHVWLWTNPAHRGGRMTELLPHVWLHWRRRHGSGVHLWFLHWRLHRWFYRHPSTVGPAG